MLSADGWNMVRPTVDQEIEIVFGEPEYILSRITQVLQDQHRDVN